MNRIKITENFYLDELVDPRIYAERGQNSIQLLDMRIVMGVQFLREKADRSTTINDYAVGGKYKESGLRRPDTPTGAKWSQHKYGRAMDVKVSGMTPSEVFAILKANEKYLIENQLITTIENIKATPTWVHIDCRYTGLDRFLIVDP